MTSRFIRPHSTGGWCDAGRNRENTASLGGRRPHVAASAHLALPARGRPGVRGCLLSLGGGIPPEGWFIPRSGSDEMIIANHPRWFNRAGLPSHLEPWSRWAVLPATTSRSISCRITRSCTTRVTMCWPMDVRSRSDTREMTIGLFSRCLGCNATMFAMTRRPGVFDGVRCMVSPQPLSSGVAPAVRRSRQLYGRSEGPRRVADEFYARSVLARPPGPRAS